MTTPLPQLTHFYFQPVVDFIEQFETPTRGQFGTNSSQLSGLQAEFKLKGRRFTTEFTTSVRLQGLDSHPTFSSVEFITDRVLQLDEVFIHQAGFEASEDSPVLFNYSATISRLQSKELDLNTPYYYRLAIPTEDNLEFRFKLDIGHSSSDRGMVSGLPVRIGGLLFHVHRVIARDDEFTNLLIVSSTNPSTLEQFQKNSYSILVSLGYITGHFIADRGYYLAYSTQDQQVITYFQYSMLRENIKSTYQPVYANAWAYIHDNRELAEEVHKQLRPVSRDEFSTLCQLANDSVEFETVCLLILEAASASMFPMAASLAVVMEALAKIIVPENAIKASPPIQNKKLAGKLRKAFTEIFEELCPDLPDESRKPILSRIEQINQKTNQASLRVPFDYLGFILSEDDLRILNTRNDFLHGRFPTLNATKEEGLEGVNRDLAYAAVGLYTLTNALILKRIGFSGRMVNYPKIFEPYTNTTLAEDYFRKL